MKISTFLGSAVALSALGGIAWYAGGLKSIGLGAPGEAAAAAAAASAASAPRPPTTVSVYAAQTRDVPVAVEAAGTVVALETVDVRPQVTGTIAEVLVKDGQFVKQGQPLFRLDDRADRANLERVKAQLLRNQASQGDLERQLKRNQDLRAQNFISQAVVDTAQANLEGQRAAVAADVAAVRAAEVSLSYTTIVAPLAGRLGAINVNRGSLVQPAAASLVMVNINQIDPIGVAFAVPESQLAGLLKASGSGAPRAGGRPASGAGGRAAGPGGGRDNAESARSAGSGPRGDAPAKAPAQAPAGERMAGGGGAKPGAGGDKAGAGKGAGGAAMVSIVIPGGERGRNAPPVEPIKGRVVFVDNAIDTTTGSIKVKAQAANDKQALWPGQYVTVRMTMRTLADAVVVPQAALIIRGNERSVYVVKPDGTVEMRSVQTRVPSGEFIVVEGVQAGEKIVVEGKQNLRPGGAVRETPYVPGAGRRGGGGGAPGAASAASGAGGGGATGPGGAGGAGGAGAGAAADMAAPPARGMAASGVPGRVASEALP